ncbi:MAG: DUF4037 domain-containing protein [Lachnospiraceae bacterium]|nr:DUF4037 domain-containing protein [Lachnospiraceae bacterium]
MQGLELAEKYYEAYGRAMIEEKFPQIADQTAAGLVGAGSECLGFDDEISMDHDYGPSFCIWLPREIYTQYGAQMQAAYEALPQEFMGFSGRVCEEQGRGRVGVLCLEDFYSGILGYDRAPVTDQEWLTVSEASLSTAVSGRVFEDRLGKFSAVRDKLMQYYPRRVWIRRLVQCMAKAAQAGQYNYARAMKRGERIAAELSLAEFVRESMKVVYLLNKCYAPYDKWIRRGMRELPVCAEIGDMLDLLYTIPDPKAAWEGVSLHDYVYNLNTEDGRVLIIEAVCNIIVQELNAQGLSDQQDNFLQNHLQTVLEKENT